MRAQIDFLCMKRMRKTVNVIEMRLGGWGGGGSGDCRPQKPLLSKLHIASANVNKRKLKIEEAKWIKIIS